MQSPGCPNCRVELPTDMLNREGLAPCPMCVQPVQALVFPAYFRTFETNFGERAVAEGESTCFFHPQKRAANVCASCGRFICSLCDSEHAGQHLCPSCFQAGQTKGKITSLEKRRVMWDSIALATAIYPLIVFYLTFITAPIAIFLAVKYWNSPSSVIQRGKTRMVVAVVIASLQIIGWIILLMALLGR